MKASSAHVEELAGAAIALAVFQMLGQAEIERRVGVGGGDQVPPGAPAAQMVERGEAARDQIGRLEGRRGRRDQPEMVGDRGERRQQGQRLERSDRGAAFQGRHRHVEDGQMIGHEEGVEAALLQLLSKAYQMAKVEIGVRIGARITPPGGMDADRAHEGAQP
jgi:hypothetical protein